MPPRKYYSVKSAEDQLEDSDLLPGERAGMTHGNIGTIFTIVTLSILVIVLALALFFVSAWSYESKDPWEARTGDVIIPIVTDIHIDTRIKECAKYSPLFASYGVAGCDTAPQLLDNLLSHLNETLTARRPEQQFLLFLGDAAAHQPADQWDAQKTMSNIEAAGAKLDRFLPGLSILPVVGNNDLPGYYKVPKVAWYSSLLRLYEPMISRDPRVTLPPNFSETFLAGGYYSVTWNGQITVVAMNTNLLSSNNKDMDITSALAMAQLAWLEEVMEGAAPQIIITGHSPPSLGFYYLYKKRLLKENWHEDYHGMFSELCARYRTRIVGTFWGHEHEDTFSLNREGLLVFSMPSVSPVYQSQPAYSIAQVGEGGALLDIHTYHTWLEFYSVAEQPPRYFRYQSLREIMEIEGLGYDELAAVTRKIVEDSDGLWAFQGLINKAYQNNITPKVSPQLFYCYSNNLQAEKFLDCVEDFGYFRANFTRV